MRSVNIVELEAIESLFGRALQKVSLQCAVCGTWANHKLILTQDANGTEVLCPYCQEPLKVAGVEPNMAEKDARRAKQWGYGEGRLTRDNKRAY